METKIVIQAPDLEDFQDAGAVFDDFNSEIEAPCLDAIRYGLPSDSLPAILASQAQLSQQQIGFRRCLETSARAYEVTAALRLQGSEAALRASLASFKVPADLALSAMLAMPPKPSIDTIVPTFQAPHILKSALSAAKIARDAALSIEKSLQLMQAEGRRLAEFRRWQAREQRYLEAREYHEKRAPIHLARRSLLSGDEKEIRAWMRFFKFRKSKGLENDFQETLVAFYKVVVQNSIWRQSDRRDPVAYVWQAVRHEKAKVVGRQEKAREQRNVSMILRHFLWKISVASVHESSWLGRLIQAASGKDGGTGRPLGNRSGDRAKADCRA